MVSQKDQQTFLNCLSDYIGFILGDEDGKRIVSNIEKTKKALFDEKEKWEEIVDKQVSAMKREDGKSSKPSEELSDKYAERVVYSKVHPKLLEIERKIKEGREISIWGTWDKISLAYSEFKSGSQHKLDLKEYGFYVTRIHNYLLKELNEKTEFVSQDSKKVGRDKLANTKSNETQIKKIEIYKSERKYVVLINDKFTIRVANKEETRQYWKYIYEIAGCKEKKSEVDSKETAGGVQSWFNSSMGNRIYKDTGLKKTKVIEYSSDFLYAAHGIDIVLMSKKKFNTL